MNSLKLLWYYLWIAPHLLQAILALLMLRRKLHRQFPMFFLYTAFEVVQFLTLFLVVRFIDQQLTYEYYVVYVFGSVVSATLRFGIIHEIANQVFRNYAQVQKVRRTLFRWTTVLLLLTGVALAAGIQVTGNPKFGLVVAAILDRTVSLLQCGLLLCLFLFSSYLGLSWRSSTVGIALGLGVFASMELAIAAFRSHFVLYGDLYIDLITLGTYHVCVLIWMFYLLAPERSAQFALQTMPEHDLEAWNHELQRLLRRL